MNKIRKHLFPSFLSIAFFSLLAFVLFAPNLFAQGDIPVSTSGGIAGWLMSFVTGNPKVSAIIGLLVVARIPLKALFTVLDTYAKANLAPAEYARIVHYENSTAFTSVSWVLDALASIKLPVINGAIAAASTPQRASSTPPPGTATSLLPAFAVLSLITLAVGCSTIDPALPGQTKPAPLVAFTNNSMYLLGHAVTTNQFEVAVQDATSVAESLVVKEYPTATNYVADVQLAISTLEGTYSPTALNAALSKIDLKNTADQALLDSFANTIVAEAEIYLGPIVNSGNTQSAYIGAGLAGLSSGLK